MYLLTSTTISGGIPWGTILPITISLAVVTVVVVLYFCNCFGKCKNKHKFMKDWIDAAKPPQLGSDGNKPGMREDIGGSSALARDQGSEVAPERLVASVTQGRKPTYMRGCSESSSEVSYCTYVHFVLLSLLP